MIWRKAILTLAPWLLVSAGALGAHPNSSIDPRVPPPTPYGMDILRGDDFDLANDVDDIPIDLSAVSHEIDVLAETEERSGPYTPDLIVPLANLGKAYQGANQHPDAIDTLKRAVHLTRINRGLYSPEQLPMLESLIESQLAMGQLFDVDASREYLFRVQQETYDPSDERLLEATRDYSEWKREAYLTGVGYQTYRRLLDIHKAHTGAAERIAEEDPDDPAQIPHLYEQVRAEYLISRYEGEKDPTFTMYGSGLMGDAHVPSTDLEWEEFRQLKEEEYNFRNGRKALDRIVELEAGRDNPSPEDQARALIALGDWYMWWDRKARAVQQYERAYEIMDVDPEHGADPAELFERPLELPVERVFHATEMTPRDGKPARAVVEFQVSRVGEARNIEVLELEPEGSMEAKLALLRMIKRFRFRPVLQDGKASRTPTVEREYNYYY